MGTAVLINLQTGRILISRHVTFDEYIFPFSTPNIPMPLPTYPNQQILSDPPILPTSIFTPPHQPTTAQPYNPPSAPPINVVAPINASLLAEPPSALLDHPTSLNPT